MPAPVLASDQNQVRGEIVALLHVVEHCGCAFLRNGTWHSSAEARKLLEHKANDAMRDPTVVPSAEQFITKLATRSSMSGKPYMVRCGEAKSVESGPWLMAKLVELRASATPATPAPPAPRTTAPR